MQTGAWDYTKQKLKRVPAVIKVYRAFCTASLRLRGAKMTPFGFKMLAHKSMQEGHCEPYETKAFRQLVGNADVIVNAGANVGYYVLHALSLGKPVIAFEPLPWNLALLRRNLHMNHWTDKVEIFPIALGAKESETVIYGWGGTASLVRGWAGASAKEAHAISVSSLDLVIGDRLNGKNILVLVDVEGYEYELLKGAEKLLGSQPKPIWMIEIALTRNRSTAEEPTNPRFIETFELFWRNGYEAYGARQGQVEQIPQDEIRQQPSVIEAKYGENFMFADRNSEETQRKLLHSWQ